MSSVDLVLPVSMETCSGMLRVLELMLRTDRRLPGLDFKSMFTDSKNVSFVFLEHTLDLSS